ncbi:hypothetical protein DSAG12_01165 [Promethearchaeum syntrophicum]|uniref:Uncharacterized protein n=1 Tax=Promethearchaeum syntrophicum TaxID=2594042 RepID=A0A5B9D9D7_9ARCH|nr:hypothetical protein [Candidatus Prometheoarchaeum syntrophicum]QEE15340.1 hypothetical protein DSAG12_01165 [Candidatus Prometheoarchaeum syntrophicum]
MSIPHDNIIAYKLLNDGSILKVLNEDLLSFFININIISVYFYKEKRLYIWKGENVPRNLQNHIPIIEEQIVKLNPNISILRHFTIEGVKEETTEFLDLLKINQEDFKKQLEEWDDFRGRMLTSIEILQNEIKEHFANKEFREIQIKAKNIINIAEKIQANDIIKEQEKTIQQIKEKPEEEEISSKTKPLIEEESESLKEEAEPLKEEAEPLKDEEAEPLKDEEAEPLKEEEAELLKEVEAEPLKEEEAEPLKEEEAELLKEEEIESEDYNHLLRQANLIESRSPNETKEILTKCLDIITKNREKFIEENPKRVKDEAILEKRI